MSTATTHIETDKNLVPALRFNEFDGDWSNKQLKEICTFFSGGTPTSSNKEYYTGDIPFIGSGNIFDSNVSNYITEEALNSSSAKIVEVGDLLYALYGANSGEVGISKMTGAINQAILCIRTESEKIEFIHCLLVLNKDKIVGKYLQGGQGNLSANIVKKLKYHFPSLPEQQKIASFLSAVDEKIQQLTKKKELLEQYKKGVMQQLFSGQLRFKDENGIPYPDWEEKRLGEVGNIVSGLTYSPDDIDESGVLVLRSSNVHGRQVTFDDNVYVNVEGGKFNPVEENDILICVRNGSKRLIGKNALIKGEAIGVAFGAFMTIYRSLSNLFLFHYFDTVDYKKEVHKNLGATINSINGSDLKKFKIPFPCEEEQQKIATYLSSIDTKIESVNNQITQTQTFKKGLLQQMFVAA